MTQKEMFMEIIEVATEIGREDIKKFAEERIEALNKKSTNRKENPNAEENKVIKIEILNLLSDGKPRTISDMMAENEMMSGLTHQRISYIANTLFNDVKIFKIKYKKYMYFYSLNGKSPKEFFEAEADD